ncbi:hypothetical protein COO60DRAFT_224796 [Scenedesmus sp. NREL 46B-D3]|nr:hypothetical protein COO60DRAFT_224796 [Scenedesmus sp. NREL 46B-D3]
MCSTVLLLSTALNLLHSCSDMRAQICACLQPAHLPHHIVGCSRLACLFTCQLLLVYLSSASTGIEQTSQCELQLQPSVNLMMNWHHSCCVCACYEACQPQALYCCITASQAGA